MITQEAIEAARAAIRKESMKIHGWGESENAVARAALEAAAPFLRAQALEDAATALDGEFTEIRRAQDKPFTWLCGIADAEQHLRACAATERGQG